MTKFLHPMTALPGARKKQVPCCARDDKGWGWWVLVLALALGGVGMAGAARGQQMVAFVPTAEATTSGALVVTGDKSLLGGASVVTSLVRPAHLTMARGGSVLLCQESQVHLSAGRGGTGPAGVAAKGKEMFDPLLIALDRGGMEVRMPVVGADTVVTGEMRLTSAAKNGKSASLELAMRVMENGDTCVESHSKGSPAMTITDAFGRASYVLKGGQHAMFHHGLIQEVVEGDTTSCGCPPVSAEAMSIADAAVRGGAGSAATFDEKASLFPFPTQTDAGKESVNTEETAGATHVQVAGTLIFEASAPETASADAVGPAMTGPAMTGPEVTGPGLVPAAAGASEAVAKPAMYEDEVAASVPVAPVAPAGRRRLAKVAAAKSTEGTVVASAEIPARPVGVKAVSPAPVKAVSAPAPVQEQKRGHSIGAFFKKLFGG